MRATHPANVYEAGKEYPIRVCFDEDRDWIRWLSEFVVFSDRSYVDGHVQ